MGALGEIREFNPKFKGSNRGTRYIRDLHGFLVLLFQTLSLQMLDWVLYVDFNPLDALVGLGVFQNMEENPAYSRSVRETQPGIPKG